MSSPTKKPKISIKFSADNTSIELFNELHIDNKIKNSACIPYLEHLFKVKNIIKTLSTKSPNPSSGLNKMIFLKYADLPGIIGERLFAISDKNKDYLKRKR